ncbi:Type 1 glutamine amidotransferase-like domain-containing protein [Spirosoma utsteinense]|uniref:Cyanophycinase n=1 Tax=Spirosoma utsteinense TaxID=2585773 RepID=A0ABR6W6Z3_9BACT|nr:cyanophycinase [Spirosoma utsteinense]
MKTQPIGGVVLAGGSTDVAGAMRWLLRRANGGDVVIIRASGSDGYNAYLYSQLGERVNSVETLLVNTRELASHPDIVRKVRQAEAIFFAGGDQANYINFYQKTPLIDAVNDRIRDGVVLGGTSAGCAILGQLYFSAKEGSVTSEEALADPFDKRVTIGSRDFLMHPLLANILTDQHYTARNRQGRHLVFLARARADWNVGARGIGVDEKTAVCVSPDGTALVFGQGNAYFLTPASAKPERLQTGQPLTWHGTGQAVHITVVPGSATGAAGFNVETFRGVDSLKTEYWSVENGVFKTAPAH